MSAQKRCLQGRCHPSRVLLGLVFLCTLPSLAWAWPVDVELLLKKGEARFVKPAAVEWVEVDEPSIVSAELFETKEILFEAKKPGTALLLLYAEGRAAVWRVVVEESAAPKAKPPPSPPNPLLETRKACPKLGFHTDKLPKISGEVDTEACRQALLFLLMQPGWLAQELELVFEMGVLASQLAQMQKATEAALGKGKVKLRYLGATLEMSGKLSPKEHRQALWSVFFQSAGRIALDDSMQVVSPPPPETPKEKKL